MDHSNKNEDEAPSPTLEKIKREISALFEENDHLKSQVRDLKIANSALLKAVEALTKHTQSPPK